MEYWASSYVGMHAMPGLVSDESVREESHEDVNAIQSSAKWAVIWRKIVGSLKNWTRRIQAGKIQGVPKKHGNSVTNSMSSFLRISIVIPDVKTYYVISSARVYFT